ncbi:Uncharacterised protein [Mycobacteroides abscessus subsp. abscessus]|nr:Uncharacterised protein [Mycobacteroides abscessus subsp. abscessus]
MYPERLASPHLRPLAGATEVELAVQPGARLIGDQMQRKTLSALTAQPFGGFVPLWVTTAVGVSEAVDGLGKDFDAPAGSVQRVRSGVLTEVRQQRQAGIGRQLQIAAVPEFVEGGHRKVQRAGPLGVDVAQPLGGGASLAELLAESESVGECRERGVVVTGVGIGRCDGFHRHQQWVVAATGEVIALQTGGGRHDDVGVLGHRGPHRVVHDDGVDPGQRAAQPGQILMMMEGVAARPIHAADVRQGQCLTVVGERLPRAQQELADGRHRDERLDGVGALRKGGQRTAHRGQPGLVHRAVAMAETASRKPDLTEHRGQGESHPGCLLTMAHPLQGPADRHQSAPGRHAAGQGAQLGRVQATDGCRPLRALGYAVVDAQ